MNQNICEEDIFNYVFSKRKLPMVKQSFIQSNLERFQNEVSICELIYNKEFLNIKISKKIHHSLQIINAMHSKNYK